jgi:hypothetical protein
MQEGNVQKMTLRLHFVKTRVLPYSRICLYLCGTLPYYQQVKEKTTLKGRPCRIIDNETKTTFFGVRNPIKRKHPNLRFADKINCYGFAVGG